MVALKCHLWPLHYFVLKEFGGPILNDFDRKGVSKKAISNYRMVSMLEAP